MVGRKRGFRKSSIRFWQADVTADFSATEKPVDLTFPLGSRRFSAAWHRLSPIPGEERGQIVDFVIVDAREHVGEPGLRIDVIELRRHDQRRHDGSAGGAAIRASEEPGIACASSAYRYSYPFRYGRRRGTAPGCPSG